MNSLLRVITVTAFLLEVAGTNPNGFTCVLNDCYTAIREPIDFGTSARACAEKRGHLMTVRTPVSSAAIRQLLFYVGGEFWIGLQLPSGRCSSTESGLLRGYEWSTGDNNTYFTNWKSNETVCSQMCVSVSSDLVWTERPCQDKIEGFLCENNYNSTCPALRTRTAESVWYNTPVGYTGEKLLSLPPGTVATRIPSGIKHICAPETSEWRGSPWSCDIDNGGCDFQCRANKGMSECTCKDGFKFVTGKCRDIDECHYFPCEHECINTPGGYSCSCYPGYRATVEDPSKCELHCESEECPAVCDVNNDNSCFCPDGYILDERKGVRLCCDIDECGLHGSECDHMCENTFGGYICSCESGYDLIEGYKCVRREIPPVSTTHISLFNDLVTSSPNYMLNSASAKTPGILSGITLLISVKLQEGC